MTAEEIKIELRHKVYHSSGKYAPDNLKIWWWNQHTPKNPNKLIYNYLGSNGVHNNVTYTDYVDVPLGYSKDNSKLKIISENDKDYVVLTKYSE